MAIGKKKASPSIFDCPAHQPHETPQVFASLEHSTYNSIFRKFMLKTGNIVGLICLAFTAVAGYFLFIQKSPRELALEALWEVQWATEGDKVDIQLDDCRLDISITQASENSLRRSRLSVNLSDFSQETVNITPINNGRAIVTLIPKPVSDQQLATAQRLLSKVPISLQNRPGHTLTLYRNDGTITQNSPLPKGQEGPVSKADLRSLLQQPNGKLSFQLRALIPDTEPGQPLAEIQPHADAPALSDFVNSVEVDTTITGYTFNLIYNAETAARDTLVLGGLEFPTQVRLGTRSPAQARETAQALLSYSQTNCR
ncbi:hypothetical protein [Pseudophaeobacter sp.]|uniref:hypothetical protein n=1 Tax=Pseudophaeobacter sp. TaxID=1971739 RepID=UPI00329A7A43